MAHILVLSDDPGSALQDGLEDAGFIVTQAGNSTAIIDLLEREHFDLIAFDIGLAGDDGMALARELRATHDIPIVMISAKITIEDRISGLENGAEDYIGKPFDMREVVLRFRKILVRHEPLERASAARTHSDGERYRLDAGVLDVSRRELRSHGGEPIKLTDAELDLLVMLVRRPNRILSRDEMMRLLKGRDWSPLERTLDKHIGQLRKKIEPQGDSRHFIKSVRAVGYVYTGAVERI